MLISKIYMQEMLQEKFLAADERRWTRIRKSAFICVHLRL